jgi:IQ calmodulin-binding motif
LRVDVNSPATLSIKRPSPLNVWAAVTDKPKLSARSKSPSNVWTALNDSYEETGGFWDINKSENAPDVRHTVMHATTTTSTTSNSNPLKPDVVYGRGSLIDGQVHATSMETIDDGTTVSGVTNPTFFPEDKPAKFLRQVKAPSMMSKSEEISLNGASFPVLSSQQHSTRMHLPALSDDDFSDPFFPNGTDEVAKEESGVSEAPDPELDHVEVITDIETDDEVPSSKRSAVRNRHRRYNRTIPSNDHTPTSVIPSNEKVDKTDPLVELQFATRNDYTIASQHNGVSTSMAKKVRERNRKPNSRQEMKDVATNILESTMKTKPPMIIPPSSTVSIRVAVMETKPTEPVNFQKKSASPFRRSIVRMRDSSTPSTSKEVKVEETPKNISTNNHVSVRSNHVGGAVGEKGSHAPTKSVAHVVKSVETRREVNTLSSSSGDLSQKVAKRQIHPGDLSISSVGSDFQRLRSILRRSRLQGNAENVRYIEPLESAFASYDEKQIKDPMQRAGLRLLSAAVIPIQSAVRRYLAFRTALVRMWAIVTIQAVARRWLVRYDDFKWATIKIQSLYRGGKVRDKILLEHCCAIEIQRHVRGLIASWYVYDELYKITLVQACARRKLAIDHAMDRMVAVIQVQAACRGFLVRHRRNRLISAITCIQTSWRAFSCRFNYQLDLLDVIIVQSIWRKQSAIIKFRHLQQEHRVSCAVKIQSQWRSYDCSMNYLHFIADLLVTQSIVRRWIAIQWCNKIRKENALVLQTAVRAFLARLLLKKMKSAIVIQSAYRGFVCYADYMFTISDIVLVQSVARRWIKQKVFPKLLHDHKSNAAITIQKKWRGFSQASDYFVMLQEKKAAIVIQSAWRRFVDFSVFIAVIDSAIRIQSAFRGHTSRLDMFKKVEAVLTIQCALRAAMAKTRVFKSRAAHELFVESVRLSDQQRSAALVIQRAIRGAQVRDAVGLYVNTRVIQSTWRGCVARALFHRHLKARSIQSIWRCHVALVDFELYKKAKCIQTEWRRYVCRSTFLLYISARSIQSFWRGYIARSSYDLYIKARSIQTVWRQHSARLVLLQEFKARSIQAAWRGVVVRKNVDLYLAARSIQSAWRGYVIRATMKLYLKARSIQAAWRGYLIRWPYKEYLAARVIQSLWRRRAAQRCLCTHFEARRIQAWWRCQSQRKVFIDYKSNVAATQIQAFCRCMLISKAYVRFLAARRIQTAWRGTSVSRAYRYFVSVRLIQALWRAKVVYRAYRQFVCARRIQAVWRGRVTSRAYREYVMARRIQTFWRCKTMCLAFHRYQQEREGRYRVFDAVCRIQAFARKNAIELAFAQYIATRRIQTFWRAKSVYNSYEMYRADRLERRLQFLAARKIQAYWRCSTLSRAYTLFQEARSARYAFNSSAVRIQSSWRAASLHKALTQYVASRNIQAAWRGRLIRSAYVQFMASRRIQTAWRCAITRSAYTQYQAARRIQATWRGKFLRTAYQEYLASQQIQLHWQKITSSGSDPARSLASDSKLAAVAATAIAAAWRSFSARQQYWHLLGSAIEIQTVIRGWLGRRRLQEVKDLAVIHLRTVHSKVKSKTLALHHRNARRLQNPSSETPTHAVNYKEQRADAAARTIQRFFLMVKAEVDRAIRSEQKRRKAKKRSKKKRDSFDDKLLESAWRKTIEDDLKYLECVIKVNDSFATPRLVSNCPVPMLLSKGSEERKVSTSREMLSLATPTSASGRLGVVPLSVSSFGFDNESVSRGGGAPPKPRPPTKSRLSSMSSREIDEDFLLEEAWIDSKIRYAKERRGHRVIDPYHSSSRSAKSRGWSAPPPPTAVPSPATSRRHPQDRADRRPPRRAQEV